MVVSWAYSSPAELRAHHAQEAATLAGPLPEDVEERALAESGDFRGGLLFTPAEASAGAIVYFHGGGFVAGSPLTHRSLTAWLAKFTRMRVLSARYRLAPEHRFPAQRQDAVAACRAALVLDPGLAAGAPLFLAGDSAGACVALWALRALDAPLRAQVAGLLLYYGGFGLLESDSIARFGTPESGLDAVTLAVMYQRLYEAGGPEPEWPLDFAGEIVEPAYVLAVDRDPVSDDSRRLFLALKPAGDANRFVTIEGEEHGFLKGAGRSAAATAAVKQAADWIGECARKKLRT